MLTLKNKDKGFNDKELLLSIVTDISNISFTSAGFVLTFLTLLISFKISSQPVVKQEKTTLENTYEKYSIFNLFLSSLLYAETIKHLKNGVKKLLVIAIVSLVLWRSLLVLSGVLSAQDKDDKSLVE